MLVRRDEALEIAVSALEGRGAPAAHARLQAEVLVEAELKGHPSHGLQRLPRLIKRIDNGVLDPTSSGRARWRGSSLLEVDGGMGFGPVVACAALDELRERVESTGIAIAAIRNSNHLGMLAYYVERLAGSGLAGIALSSSEALVHPFGGTRAMLGTNPLAIAVPTANRPLVLDFATGLVSMGKIHHHAANDMPIPDGWARDANGRPTTDASMAKHGAIAPFGGAKGYGLGIAIELLVAALAGSALAPDIHGTLDADAVCNKGDILIAMTVNAGDAILGQLSDYLNLVRHSPAADPDRPVAVPGDGASARRDKALRDGFDISPRLWDELTALSEHSSALLRGNQK